MADRVEREIEEILAKLDGDAPPAKQDGRAPISLASRRKRRPRLALTLPSIHLSPAGLLFAGAGIMLLGLVAASFWSPAIWLSFAGVVVFLGAFVSSFFRAPSAKPQPKGVFWRDRYIEYAPASESAFDRLKKRFRR
ncbi:MAG: hypothetical protein HY875_05085 [Chloroflexi bacterium]|nr:hypothetical protein [Chloroflexota bacterium]